MKYVIKCSYTDMFNDAINKICDTISSNKIDRLTFEEVNKSNTSGAISIFEFARYLLAMYGSKRLKEMCDDNLDGLRHLIKRHFAEHYHQFSHEEYISYEQQSVQDLALKINDIYESIIQNTNDTAYVYLVNKEVAESTLNDPKAIDLYDARLLENGQIAAHNAISILEKAGIEYTNGEMEIDFDDDNATMTINGTEFAFALSPITISDMIDKDIRSKQALWASGDVSAKTGFSYPTIALSNALSIHGFSCKYSRLLLSFTHYNGLEKYNSINVAKSAVIHNYSEMDNKINSITESILRGKFYSASAAQRGKFIRNAYEKVVSNYLPNEVMYSSKYEKYLAETNMNPDIAWLFAYYEYVNDLVYVMAKTLTQLSLELPKRIYKGETYTHLFKRKGVTA